MTRFEKYKERRQQLHQEKLNLKSKLIELKRLCVCGSRTKIRELVDEILNEYVYEK